MRQLKITNKITTRESLALDKYLNDIGRIELLTIEEETRLAKRIKAGDPVALERMTRANLRFVVSVAKQYQNQGLPLSDLINEGNVGLMKAAQRFDESKGFKFISYAVWWIRQSILQSIVDHAKIVRQPLNKASSYHRVNDAYLSFVQEFEREPSDEELADVLGVQARDVRDILKGRSQHVSVNAPLREDEEDSATILDMMPCEVSDYADNGIMRQSLREEVLNCLECLSPREADVVAAYYGLRGHQPMNMEEIGEYYDLSRERVRQIKDRAMRRLKRSCIKANLRQYLGE
jgi:RNA polymerase primary sigma factor